MGALGELGVLGVGQLALEAIEQEVDDLALTLVDGDCIDSFLGSGLAQGFLRLLLLHGEGVSLAAEEPLQPRP